MRIKHRYLRFESKNKDIKTIRKILDKYSNEYKYSEDLNCVVPTFKYNLEFEIYEDLTYFLCLQKELCKFDLLAQIETVYEKNDIENAEWFIIRTGQYQYPQPEDNYTEQIFKPYCNICGIGKIQTAPYQLKEPKQRNNQFWGLFWEHDAIFVRNEAKNILEKEQIKGISFSQPMLYKKNVSIENFYQLHIHNTLNKGFDNYNSMAITCKYNNEEGDKTDPNCNYCGQIKYLHPKVGGYLFDKNIFNKEFDIFESYEYFGSGGYAEKLHIVSKRLKELIEKNKLRGLVFIPIIYERFKG